ncbi:MAG: ABC transporter permease [Candidatus Obscuribacterales bacterium]
MTAQKSRILVQAQKEWQEFQRDRLSLALAFLLPLFSLLLFGYGIRLEAKNIAMVVQDNDQTSFSREYIDRLYATNLLVRADVKAAKSPRDAIDRGLAKVAIIVPSGFTEKVFRKEKAVLDVLIDGTDIANTQIVSNSIKAANIYFVAGMKASKIAAPASNIKVVSPQLRVWFNPGRLEPLFIVPGAIGIILWMYPALLAAVAASREKEQGTIIRVYASTITPLEFLLGKALVYFLVGMVLSLLVIALGWVLFDVKITSNPFPLLVALPLYVLASVLFGLLLGTLANSQTVAVQATSTAGFFPCLLLSGFVYPIYNIPYPLNLFTVLVPARFFIELCRDTFVRGAGWYAVWTVPLILMLFCLVYLCGSWLSLRGMRLKD